MLQKAKAESHYSAENGAHSNDNVFSAAAGSRLIPSSSAILGLSQGFAIRLHAEKRKSDIPEAT
jgi:hypothetical protein